MRLHDVVRPMSQAVPAFVLANSHIKAIGRRFFWSCHCCDFPVSAMSELAINTAMDEHAAFVNITKDRREDPHFHEVRMDALLAS